MVIPDGVTEIGSYAFSGCKSLGSITIPDSVTEIGEDAFYDCIWLDEVYISDIAAWCRINFVNIDSNPLYYAGDLYLNGERVTRLVIPNGVTEIGSCAFCGFFLLESISIPHSVTTIGDQAFRGSFLLQSVTIPDSVTTIGDGAFDDCESLRSIIISDSVTTIGDSAFQDCESLTSITIPDSVTEIGDRAFYSCGKLREVYCNPLTPPSIGSEVFDYNASGRKIYVPFWSFGLYTSALNWSDYSSDIKY